MPLRGRIASRTFCQLEASESVDMRRLTSSSAPLSFRDGESDDMRRYLMVIRTFCQQEASEPVDTQRLTSSSAPLSSKDGKSDDMWRLLMVIRTYCQLEASEAVDTQRLTSSSAPFPEMLASSGRDCEKVLFAVRQTQGSGSMQ